MMGTPPKCSCSSRSVFVRGRVAAIGVVAVSSSMKRELLARDRRSNYKQEIRISIREQGEENKSGIEGCLSKTRSKSRKQFNTYLSDRPPLPKTG